MNPVLFVIVERRLVLEKNPPKQGLKLAPFSPSATPEMRFREKSTKTRIETIIKSYYFNIWFHVLEKNPPKQGLKPYKIFSSQVGDGSCFREKSTKTRIETFL